MTRNTQSYNDTCLTMTLKRQSAGLLSLLLKSKMCSWYLREGLHAGVDVPRGHLGDDRADGGGGTWVALWVCPIEDKQNQKDH